MLYLAHGDFLEMLVERNEIIAFVAIVAGATVVGLGIVFGAVKTIVIGRARENTKRELAAYVSEGRLEPDKAVAMLNAGKKAEESC